MAPTVREASLTDPDDVAAIVALTEAFAQDSPGGLGEPLPPEVLERLVPAMREHGKVRVLLAEDGDEAVGLCTCIVSFSAFNAAPVLNLHDVVVLPNRRDHGIGHVLLEGVEELARSLDCCRMTVEVVPGNPARDLYEDMGFEHRHDFFVRSLGQDRVP